MSSHFPILYYVIVFVTCCIGVQIVHLVRVPTTSLGLFMIQGIEKKLFYIFHFKRLPKQLFSAK